MVRSTVCARLHSGCGTRNWLQYKWHAMVSAQRRAYTVKVRRMRSVGGGALATKGQGPGMVNVLLAAPQQLVHDLRIKGPGARDGERSFGCQPSDSFTTSAD